MPCNECSREPSKVPMDVNIYATRKTVAQGMMDIALFTSNASQLKYVLSHAELHDYFIINVALIGTSMVLQIVVGIMLIFVGRSNINYRKHQKSAEDMNNAIVVLIFLITVINVLITAFSVDVEENNVFTAAPPMNGLDDVSDKIADNNNRLKRDLLGFWPNCSQNV